MNEVKIEAGKVGRSMSGYTFSEKENELLDKIQKLDFGASSIFLFWIARIIRQDKNWKENTKLGQVKSSGIKSFYLGLIRITLRQTTIQYSVYEVLN